MWSPAVVAGAVVVVTTASVDVLTAVADAGAPPDWSSSTWEFTRAAAEPATSTPPIDSSIAKRALGAFILPASFPGDGTASLSVGRTGDVQESSNNVADSTNGSHAEEPSSTMKG